MTTKNKTLLNWLIIAIVIMPVFSYAQNAVNIGWEKAAQLPRAHTDNSEVLLTQGPSEIMDDSSWIHYDDVDLFDSWGFLISGEEYDIVAKWDAAELSNYDGWEITKIKFIVTNSNPYLKVKVWEGPNTTEIYSQDVDSYLVNDWTEVVLDTPVAIDVTTELWVGYHVDMTHTELGGIVTATDDGPPVDDYGNLCRWNGSWYSDFNNHNLQVLLEANLTADFEADVTEICYGSTVNFTNLSTAEDSYLWTFEGGTPATSTDENPSVVYDTPGYYDVTLEVSFGNESSTEIKQEYIHVLETPGKADMPDGDSEVCTISQYFYETNEVDYATDYEWEIDPTDAGTLTWENTEATLQTDDTWTGDYTIKVRATNLCGDGDWSDEFECTLYASPEEFNLEGGGGYCLGGDGAEITLDGSQTDVDYELFLDGETTGITVEGTGSEISFGLLTEEGYYSAVGSNDNCDYQMSGQIEVNIDFPPLEPATPIGPTSICEETSSDYATEEQDDADSFVWVISPAEAGTITGEGIDATVEWDSEYFGLAYISVYGINDCGDGNPSSELEVSVGAPTPEISGEDLVCDFSEETYEVVENGGSTYTWTVNGGEITEGQGTYMVTISWPGEGSGSLSVEEETADGCSGASEEFDVMIDDCTGIGEEQESSVSLYPNPVSGNELSLITKSIENTFEIEIFSVSGQRMLQQSLSGNNNKIDISSLSKGYYFLKLSDEDNNQQLLKFVKN